MLFFIIMDIMYSSNSSNHFCDVNESLESWKKMILSCFLSLFEENNFHSILI